MEANKSFYTLHAISEFALPGVFLISISIIKNCNVCKISSNLIKSLSEGELKVVLLHESYHLKHRDPLKIILSQVATTMFFFVPILKDIHSHYALSKEISADLQANKTKGYLF